MTSSWDQLRQTFIDDHQVMIRGYRDMLHALEQRDLAAAARLSAKVDAIAGPHIEFEEQYLYPAVKELRGDAYVSRLYDEHNEVLSVIAALQTLAEDVVPSDDEISGWKESLKAGLDHAAACGSLLSHLQALPDQQQRDYLDAIGRLRRQGRRWSEMHEANN